jgi:hypothetical protein
MWSLRLAKLSKVAPHADSKLTVGRLVQRVSGGTPPPTPVAGCRGEPAKRPRLSVACGLPESAVSVCSFSLLPTPPRRVMSEVVEGLPSCHRRVSQLASRFSLASRPLACRCDFHRARSEGTEPQPPTAKPTVPAPTQMFVSPGNRPPAGREGALPLTQTGANSRQSQAHAPDLGGSQSKRTFLENLQ